MTLDPGLQSQRTMLAWARTGIAGAVLAALVLRHAVAEDSLFHGVVATVCLLGAAAILGIGSRVFRPSRRLPDDERGTDYRGVRAATGIVLVLGSVSGLSLLFG